MTMDTNLVFEMVVHVWHEGMSVQSSFWIIVKVFARKLYGNNVLLIIHLYDVISSIIPYVR